KVRSLRSAPPRNATPSRRLRAALSPASNTRPAKATARRRDYSDASRSGPIPPRSSLVGTALYPNLRNSPFARHTRAFRGPPRDRLEPAGARTAICRGAGTRDVPGPRSRDVTGLAVAPAVLDTFPRVHGLHRHPIAPRSPQPPRPLG